MEISVPVGSARTSALWISPEDAKGVLVLAHSAGRDMRESFLEGLANALAERSIASLRFQFLHVERGEERPRSLEELNEAVLAAAAEASRRSPSLPLFSGGKSLGGRITSQLSAQGLLPETRGVLLLGFPLHAEGKPSCERTGHLDHVRSPMLFVQGGHDALASLDMLRPRLRELGPAASLHVVAEVNHGYQPREGSSRTPDEVLSEVVEAISGWMRRILDA